MQLKFSAIMETAAASLMAVVARQTGLHSVRRRSRERVRWHRWKRSGSQRPPVAGRPIEG